MLRRIQRDLNPNLLVGFDKSDDAGVFRLSPDLALVQTVDFFTPIVDDPFTFGAIAAANSLSDVYAMGGTPLTALSILAWPGSGDLEDLEEILQGGAEKMREAGCVILGGHSVDRSGNQVRLRGHRNRASGSQSRPTPAPAPATR